MNDLSTPVVQNTNEQVNQPTYEFTDQENKIFVRLSRQILINAFFWMLGGLLFYVLAFVNIFNDELIPAISFFLDGIIQFGIGLSIIRSYDNFNNIANTEGSDIHELIQGLKDLTLSFRLTAILIIFVVIIEWSLGML